MIQTLFQHDDFTIVNKPAGLSCHNDTDSLIHQLGKGWHLVNRIDRETSGLVVVTQKADLQKKVYSAVLRGNMPQSTGLWNEWTYPISDLGEGRETPQGKLEDQKESKTLYTVVQSNPYFSAVHCQLITGRQHQIRKHSRLAGRPILGDPRYGNAKDNERISKMYDFHRMALHSWKIELVWKGESINCESPVPESFAQLFVAKT
jgi:23S rRNA-/tRNA-specific pseudouridylate synthase